MRTTCLGPAGWAPVSEQFGRRWLTTVTFFVFCIWTMACALAPNWPAFLVFRLFVGIFASAPIAVVAGIMADMYDEPRTRGRAMAVFMVVCDVSTPLLDAVQCLRTCRPPSSAPFWRRSSPVSALRPSDGGGLFGSASYMPERGGR